MTDHQQPDGATGAPVPARIKLDPDFRVGPLNRRIFGSFVEHLGRCVYTGIYEPEHPTADEYGFRADVAELVRELGPTIIRYPGGNFVSNYKWEDGVGPRSERPVRLDLAWKTIETNQVGTDEFLQWCQRLDLEPMMAVNLGTRGITEASELLQYCNAEGGIELADRRAKNGHADPYDVRVWCLGNEMDGPWQMGFKTPEEYARLAEETARAMKRFDEKLELVACGSSNRSMPTFGSWERIVLDRCIDLVDHISAHAYYEPIDGDHDSFLASAEDMDRFISSVVATADHVAAARKSDKKIMISFDEWNVWFQKRWEGERKLEIRETSALIEDVYDVEDAVVIGSLLIELIRHTDRVAIACQAQLVNVIAPILTAPGGVAWRQTIFHPFALTAKYAHGVVLQPAVSGPGIDTQRYGEVGALHATTVWNADAGELVIFAANRDRARDLDLTVDLGAFADLKIIEHLHIADDERRAYNSPEQPDRVVPKPGASTLNDGRLTGVLPAASWHCIRIATSSRSEG
ncbi:alpha-N-arabinofuranosidase [Microlunatus parietis]|uniref:non-reducing end alpha-L-arabinofuranosidase n=1 Tax=Microlunatus parietis TaxID=682979 RepID=A0A7Y9I933_9ACTN|nr:alpha-N-arabinofuranosidase [Microlunatus parietis]NYE72278.1 alpha-N-arabinofuranosidase [Microlunatus parietis]